MNRRFVSALACSSTVAAAFAASAVMTGAAIAQTSSNDPAGPRSRADVQAEVISHRDQISAAGYEWRLQQANQPDPSGGRSRAEVQAEVMSQRGALSAAGSEWELQANAPQERTSTITRSQATAEYIASRDMVRALTSEDSGSAYLAQARARMQPSPTMVAGREQAR